MTILLLLSLSPPPSPPHTQNQQYGQVCAILLDLKHLIWSFDMFNIREHLGSSLMQISKWVSLCLSQVCFKFLKLMSCICVEIICLQKVWARVVNELVRAFCLRCFNRPWFVIECAYYFSCLFSFFKLFQWTETLYLRPPNQIIKKSASTRFDLMGLIGASAWCAHLCHW